MPPMTARPVSRLVLLMLVGISTTVFAQTEYPRIGLSAARDTYLDHITVPVGTEFELYAIVTGFRPGEAMNQPVQSLPWVIHQVCCGSVIEVLDLEFNPDLHHEGHPLAGMVSSVETCVDQDTIWLVSLKVRLVAGTVDEILWAGGPFGTIRGCEGQASLFLGLAVTIFPEAGPTPDEASPWGKVKAMYH